MSSIYHYCTVESFKSILEHKTIRLSDISKSNDPNEIKFIYEAYLKWIIENNQNSKFKKTIKEILELQSSFNEDIKNVTYLVSCFSKKNDDLHMWNCYGNKGICIEFDREKLERHIKCFQCDVDLKNVVDKSNSKFNKLTMENVEYHSEDELYSIFKNFFLTNKNINKDTILFELAPIVKNNFFGCEDEVRIVYRFIGEKVNKLDFIFESNYLIYKKTNEKVYFKSIASEKYLHKMVLDIPIKMEFIKGIKIGPNCSLSVKDICELLFIFGITHLNKRCIKKSEGSLR